MRGIEDLMRALDERPLTLHELFSLVSEYKQTIIASSPEPDLQASHG